MVAEPISGLNLAVAARLWKSGNDTLDIAQHMGVSEASVFNALQGIRKAARAKLVSYPRKFRNKA